jgi:hypothetical protein
MNTKIVEFCIQSSEEDLEFAEDTRGIFILERVNLLHTLPGESDAIRVTAYVYAAWDNEDRPMFSKIGNKDTEYFHKVTRELRKDEPDFDNLLKSHTKEKEGHESFTYDYQEAEREIVLTVQCTGVSKLVMEPDAGFTRSIAGQECLPDFFALIKETYAVAEKEFGKWKE